MKLATRVADPANQLGFDDHVNVFQGRIKLNLAGGQVGLDLFESLLDRIALCRAEQADGRQHPGMGHGAADVVGGQAVVVTKRFDKRLRQPVGGLGDACLPGFLGRGTHRRRF